MQTVFEAAGGNEGLRRLAYAWHKRVMADDVVAHAFSHGFHPQHVERLAAYWAEALGGATTYSDSAVGLHGTHPSSPRAALTMAGERAIASIASYEFQQHTFHIGKLRLWELPFLAQTYTDSHDTISNIAGCR